MSSRDSILAAVARNQPELLPLQEVPSFASEEANLGEKFSTVAVSIGSKVFRVQSIEEAKQILLKEHSGARRVISVFPEFADVAEASPVSDTDPHTLADVDLAVLPAQLGVAENAALWVTDAQLPLRVLPFICQNLALVVPQQNIIPLMHHAYDVIGAQEYGFGTFIAGPSKTADIEQSLVLGAHGARTLSVFILV
ncbi:L-lactate dehydrogenase complex protein LldG [Pontibacter ummariensis]|uniref:L-lactate dehydrogenase complex protein LldG n=1 Tax=Pontibacter ummariensis TaxID=1610492 RepID=A0A239LU55_9BACT|nr:LUD domain-containing protein [Pontibacter ummariensis]PRY01204.1 L-lactate dehydrogenase complex protein LldG [Pontibacter ummariensis]SNT33800.1 L-lactate dehydrogenase complex protein LldG [Pontibacter ummariensis]